MAAFAASGCVVSTRNPERLYPVVHELQAVRIAQDDLVQQYVSSFAVASRGQARALRNEIIAQRMYAIDVQYTQYETALTRERQEVGFATLTTAEGLSTAATLVSLPGTKTILSGLTTAVIATKGHYESEILLAQTIRTIQKQMRASRNTITDHIAKRMALDVADYPLSAALGDVEDYYRAGTLTTGILDVSTTVGIEEKLAQEQKQKTEQLTLPARRTAVLREAGIPIQKPVQTPILHDEGRGFYEERLLPGEIKRLQRYVCVQEDGEFSAGLRTAILKQLNASKLKDVAYSDRITSIDSRTIMRELRASRRAC